MGVGGEPLGSPDGGEAVGVFSACGLTRAHSRSKAPSVMTDIYLDDERQTPPGFARTFTVESTIALLGRQDEAVGTLSLDNDLGEGQPEGRMVVRYLEEQRFNDPSFPLPERILVHSANPVAAADMRAGIRNLYGR
jgi:hypothetical protein